MGFKDTLISMMSDFVEQKRNPEFRSKTDISGKGNKSGEIDYPAGFNRVRRHSLNITVGTDSPTDQAVRQRTYSIRNNPPRRNTITPQATVKQPEESTDNPESKPTASYTARRFSEPFNARLPEIPVVIRRSPRLLPNQSSSTESDSGTESDSSSSRQTPATSPRGFMNSFEKRNTRFFPNPPTSWRTSALLDVDEEPIPEECEADETNDTTTSAQKSTIIKITTPTCS
ncbi:hypothetical protein M3Y98_00178800 [Aphelenchoides besseyi]|nr:hypothetical protein M3Y98_00178800 [Aphelenchoides besseyi]KAI6200084.1 hypothetical protein M3Y96_00695700 [Aphelenchoides besseyi]